MWFLLLVLELLSLKLAACPLFPVVLGYILLKGYLLTYLNTNLVLCLMAMFLRCLHHMMVMHLMLLDLCFARDHREFIYNGFHEPINLHLDGVASVYPNGLLQLTNLSVHKTAHAFYPHPMIFKPNSSSFSTTFVCSMVPEVPDHSGHGIVFVISPSMNFQNTLPSGYLGLFNASTKGLSSNHVFAVELDTLQNAEYGDIDGNHVGIDVNSLISIAAAPASYYSDKDGVNKGVLLNSGKPMQVWIDYDDAEMLVSVTLAPINHPRPSKSLLSKHFNLSSILLDSMYVGFSSSTGLVSNYHYLLGWSWNQSGQAQGLDPSKLPSLPRIRNQRQRLSLTFLVLLVLVVVLLLVIAGAAWSISRKKYEEFYEPWEKEYAPDRFSYKDLFVATKGFRNSELLGVGGFGKVYKGVLPSTHVQIAVKKISHDSRQGMREFMAEIVSMRRLRHRNLVQLLGYCRRKGELLLVYDYMPNGSLDKFLFGENVRSKISWFQRFKIMKGVASALLYLHEEWEQVVLHRDVKASNVLLDVDMNARLGDFGLARLYDHNTDPRTTHVVGTMGYIAPEACRTLKPTIFTDVFAFGMFLLEASSGRRPIDLQVAGVGEDVFLVDWVYGCWKRGAILEASDPTLEGSYATDEMKMVLKLGLLCVNPRAEGRPTMRQVVRFLDGDASIPDIPSDFDPEMSTSSLLPSSSSSSSRTISLGPLSSADSVLQYGR